MLVDKFLVLKLIAMLKTNLLSSSGLAKDQKAQFYRMGVSSWHNCFILIKNYAQPGENISFIKEILYNISYL